MTLGEYIRQLRTRHKMSQELLAEKMQVSRQAVTKWENNQSKPSTQKLMQLAQLFSVSFADLIEEKSNTLGKAISPWPFRIFSAVSLVCLLLFIGVVSVYWEARLPDNIIGYADEATDIFVHGWPILPVVLGLITIVSVLCTVFLYLKLHNIKRKQG